ncbi:Rhodanese-like domain-containing protein [Mycena crocata]|nr:Rhodanese-like domain-containing protein [Mycena crocata]
MLISPSNLANLMSQNAKTIVLDSSWFMPNSSRIAMSEFRAKRIPGSKFLDLDSEGFTSPHELRLKHMLPSGQDFAKTCENFGIGPSSRVVIYDTHGVFSAPRALYTFRSYGHRNSSVLDGGLPRWEAEGFPVDVNDPTKGEVEAVQYPTPTLDAKAVRNYNQIVANSTLIPLQTPGAELVVDARGRGRYMGTEPEPRPGLSSGHIPNSFSLPFNAFLQNNTSQNGSPYTTLLSEKQLRAAVVDALGPERSKAVFNGNVSVIASCGSGMTAGILWLGLRLLGVEKISIYDESWTGYSLRPSSKIETSQ